MKQHTVVSLLPRLPLPLPSEQQIQMLLDLYEEIGHALHDLDRLLSLAGERIVRLLSAEAAALFLLDEESQTLCGEVVYDHPSPGEQRRKKVSLPADRGIIGWVLREGVSTSVANIQEHPHFDPEVDAQGLAEFISYLYVPLKNRERVIGVFLVVNKHSSTFGRQDVLAAEAAANPLALAIDNARLRDELERMQEQLREEPDGLWEDTAQLARFTLLIGESPAMQKVYALIEPILYTTTTVLITGESGTGKELVARVIHSHGARAKGPFLAVNCAAIPETLLEAELFGYERGAFTGAVQRKPGRFELAKGGTLFLDEIGEMSLSLQAKLLRVLEEKKFERLGGTTSLTADVRIVAATNRDLEQLIAESKFREDLFYRLDVYPIPLPPLRERREDIAPLALHFLKKYSEEMRKGNRGLSPEARGLLLDYQWPGNIRELANVMERAVILSQNGTVTLQELPLSLQGSPLESRDGDGVAFQLPFEGMSLAELEKRRILQALEQTHCNRLQASKLLGVSRSQLRTRMRRYGLEGGAEKD